MADFLFFLQQITNGLALGAVYALLAIGFSMIYGILRMMNFAHGDLYAFATIFISALLIDEVSVILAIPLAVTYARTGLVPRLPTALLATGITILASLSFFTGLILDTVVRGRREVRRLAYLAHPAPGG